MVEHEIAVADDGGAVEDVDHSIAVISCEINELYIVEGHVGFDNLDASAVREIHLVDVTIGSILKTHAEMFCLVQTVKFYSAVVGANHGAVDGDEGVVDIDSCHLIVNFQDVICRDGEVSVDEESVRAIGDHAFGDIDEVG